MSHYYEMREVFRRERPNDIISFFGNGRSGKTTLATHFSEQIDNSMYVYVHTLRDYIGQSFYSTLERTEEQFNVEIDGIPSIAWFAVDWYWRILPCLLEHDAIPIFDHYGGDIFAIIPDATLDDFRLLLRYLGIPGFRGGSHFYLDIDYETYKERALKKSGTDLIPEEFIEQRRGRYQELCDAGYAIFIDATQNLDVVIASIDAHLSKEKTDE